MKKKKLTKISVFHYVRLFYRSLLFITLLVTYILDRVNGLPFSFRAFTQEFPVILTVIWVVFMVEMILRFFPSSLESPGCQKQFSRNYAPTGRTDAVVHDNHATFIVALLWIVLNLIIGGFYSLSLIDEGIMLLISLLYSVCDMICILFFCPFQTWFLKNKCCCACRIYNWDYAMMFTLLFFIPNLYTWSLLTAAIALLIRWEIAVWRYPERFSENTNTYLNCANCPEKLCVHKTQLLTLRRQLAEQADKTAQRILGDKYPLLSNLRLPRDRGARENSKKK